MTRVWHKWHDSHISATWATRTWHECYTNDTSVTRVLHERRECDTSFDFHNDTSENIFSHPYINYMANERLQGEQQFHSNNYLLEMPQFPCQNAFEKCTTNTELCNGKSYIKKLYIRLQLQMLLHVPV